MTADNNLNKEEPNIETYFCFPKNVLKSVIVICAIILENLRGNKWELPFVS